MSDIKSRIHLAMNPTILLVDDDDAFQTLFEQALLKSNLKASLQWVWDGEQAISYLSRQGKFQDERAFPAPALVLLDLKMQGMNGFDILRWKSTRLELIDIPFVILSSSDLERDKQRAAESGARHYLVKPLSFRGLVGMVESLGRFLNVNRAGLEQVFLCDSETGRFYKSPDQWVPTANQATRFESRHSALLHRQQISKPKLELLVLDQRGRPHFGLRLWADTQ